MRAFLPSPPMQSARFSRRPKLDGDCEDCVRVLVSGSTGLIGSALVARLEAEDHQVTRLTRKPPRPGERTIEWNPLAGRPPAPQQLENFDAVVHLAGENIARRWTEERKARIRLSRVRGTEMLAESLARLAVPPRILIAASAVGYYGDRGEEILSEASAPGKGFLAEVCAEWEAATKPAVQKGIRVVNLRTGVVLARQGGALAAMLPAFKMGVAGRIGSGKQYLSWIALDDLVGVMTFALSHDLLRGPVNAVSPNPVTNLEFTKTLGKILRRPTIFPLPAFAVRLIFGEMGRDTLLASQRVEPARLQAAEFVFQNSKLETALSRIFTAFSA